jgi:hypothetical protein
MPDPHPPTVPVDLDRTVFRSNGAYELVVFDRLPADQQEMLSDLKKQPEFYGVLRPVGDSGMGVKSVSRETALLFLTMKEPGALPEYARALLAADKGAAISRLVLDQVLEIEHGGRFLCGAEAYELLYGPSASHSASGAVQQLSISALQYGAALNLADPFQLSLRLYNYHRLPITSRWREAYPNRQAVAERLGVRSGGRYATFISSHWHETSDADKDGQNNESEHAGWLSWANRHRQGSSAATPTTHKLYVSPMPQFVENVFAVTLRTLTDTRALQLKVGADVEGLLRPDKIVAYFQSLDDMRSAADVLAPRLQGCPAHGVPFTAALDEDGLLSWGVDPPASQQLLNWQPRESWRLWLTNRLANALLTAKRTPSDATHRRPAWQYAMERLQLEGVDTETWTPNAELWR